MVAVRTAAGVRVRVPAKLNLFFEVLGKRSDGFHEIETLMAPIDLFDELSFEVDSSGAVSVECRWAVARSKADLATLGELPTAENNLATRALKLLRERAAVDQGAHVKLVKRIPAAAGLGGGSADAAAALIAANVAWKLNWTVNQLSSVAAELGSDVPFFLRHVTAVCRGRGEQIEPVAGLGVWNAVVVRPPEGLSTAEVYRHCRPTAHRRSSCPLVNAMRRGDLRGLARSLANDLQPAAEQLSPWIQKITGELARAGCAASQMSGSGTSCFGICHSRRHAHRVAAQMRARQLGRVLVVRVGAVAP